MEVATVEGTSATACIVLAGGAGRRMGGADKALADVGGLTVLDRVLSAARPVADRLVVVGPVRPTTVAPVEFTSEAVPGGGPVPGVAAGVTLLSEAETILVLAVDLPLLTSADLAALLSALVSTTAAAAAAADDRGRPNPLLAAYRAGALRAGLGRLGPDLGGVAASAVLPPDTVTVDLGREATLNVNRPADLDRARAVLGARLDG